MAGPIVFNAMDANPNIVGDLVVVLPPLRAALSEVLLPLEVDLPTLEVALDGFEGAWGNLVVELPALEFLGTDAIPGVITTVSGSLFAELPALKSSFTTTALAAPNLAELVAELPSLEFAGTGFNSTWGNLLVELPALDLRLYETASGAILDVVLPPLRLAAYQNVAPVTASLTALVQPVGSLLASATWVFESAFAFDDDMVTDLLFALRSRFAFVDEYSPIGKLIMALESSIAARDTFRFIINLDLEDEIAFTDLADIRAELVIRLASQIVFADETIRWMSAIATVASAFVLRDAMSASLGQTITSAIELTDLLEMNLAAVANLISEVEFADELTGTLHAFTTIQSDIEFTDDFAALLSLLMELEDEVLIYTRFVTPDGGSYVGYVVNVRTAAVGTLTNMPFNSMATVVVGGRSITYGAAQEGIYRFGGNDDDGEPIQARVRMGLNDFGSDQLKRVPNSFIGYTSDGRLVLKTITADGGRKKENWYSLKVRSAHSAQGERFDIAKGLTALYWGFEVENIDGADFSIKDLKVWPMVLQRRKSGR